ncbi:LysR family transcriptional regulator [Lentzea flava]|uniref:LysR family transcriptional regulator n=1 Tax=Lentzea flava TaxID=103732 RepID=A0ABQ2UXC8_9PSEU|nr:LysR family transcriptional regulator [Lentzea flava]MCP2200789.1 transcriptional regulator, LysR family [Lentzea flava]GGU55589.1 LysR family transcriptional regulator [Lentzea flava]
MGACVELRDIEIFLTLAEELHFGRAAERLHVSQARVSQAIKAQERRIGGVLFDRTSRAVTLTQLGEQLRDDLRAGYDAIHRGVARATESARGVTGTVRLGVMGMVGHELRNVIDAFRDRYPACDVSLQEIHFSDPFSQLRAGELDLAVLWRPVREPDLIEGPVLLTEGRVIATWPGHELADRPSVSLEDLADRVVVHVGSHLPEYWTSSMLPTHTPSGRPIPKGPLVTTWHQVLTLVADRKCVTTANEHVLQYYTHPGVVFVPIHDVPLTEWALVWHTDGLHPRGRGFVDVATELGPRRYGAS